MALNSEIAPTEAPLLEPLELLKLIAAVRLDGEEDPETETTVEMDVDSLSALLTDIVLKAREAVMGRG